MPTYQKLTPPRAGRKITRDASGRLLVPDDPIIPFIEGDGTGPDIWNASVRVFDASVEQAYKGKRRIVWHEIYAGEKANQVYGEGTWLPDDTTAAIREYGVAIKGPLTTPVGGGIRSINVGLRQILDLYSCVRPVRWYQGVPSPVKEPGKLDVVIFRENTEDVYSGIEFAQGTAEAKKLIDFVGRELGKKIRPDSGVGIKPISVFGTERLVRMAIRYALETAARASRGAQGQHHEFTEGAFAMGYACQARVPRRDRHEDELWASTRARYRRQDLIKDSIADAFLQQILLRPSEYDVIATLNLNGDYLSDALAAQVGGIGIAPGANINYLTGHAIFEATHGTAPKYAGQDKVNPGSVILSGVMMLRYLGWKEAGDLIERGLEQAILQKRVTYDFERQMQGATRVSCSGFGDAIVENMKR